MTEYIGSIVRGQSKSGRWFKGEAIALVEGVCKVRYSSGFTVGVAVSTLEVIGRQLALPFETAAVHPPINSLPPEELAKLLNHYRYFDSDQWRWNPEGKFYTGEVGIFESSFPYPLNISTVRYVLQVKVGEIDELGRPIGDRCASWPRRRDRNKHTY